MYSGKRYAAFLRRFVCLLPFAAGFSGATQAQQQTFPVQLTVHVFIDGYQHPAGTNVTVQLQDEFGTIESEGHTDNSGLVRFQTKTVTRGIMKSLRVFGPGIQEYREELPIESMETRKLVNVVVRSDPSGAPVNSNPAEMSSIAASRLKIPDKAEKELQKGKDATDQKDWVQARKHFEAAIAIYPDYDLAYNGLGQALASSGDAVAARSAFEKAIQINSNFAAAYRNLARLSLSERKFEEMDNLLTRSLSVEPLNAWALAYAAYAELQLHKFDDAIAHARKAHSVKHDGLASVHIVAARALEEEQQPAEALEEYRLYLQEDANGRDAERARAAVTRLSGDAPK